MAFVDEVGYYAGDTTGKNTEVSKFLANGVQWVISMIEKTNPSMLPLFAQAQTLNNSAPTLTLSTNSKIIDVVRISADSSGEALKCSPINAAYRSNAANVDSIYYASKNSPVYYIDNAVLTVLPTPEATQTATISIVLPDASVDHNDTTISNFPSEMYHAVVLYAAVQLLHNKMSSMGALLPSDLDSDTTVFDAIADLNESISITSNLPTAISITSDLPGAIAVTSDLPSSISISASLPSPVNVSEALPDSISLSSSLPSDFSTSTSLPADFSISTSLPGAINVSSIGIPSAFTFTDTIGGITLPSVPGGVANALDKARNLIDDAASEGGLSSDAEDFLNEEDEELVQAIVQTASQEVQRASAYLNEYSKEIEKGQAAFNADVQQFQQGLQKEVQRIGNEVQRHQSLLGDEQARVNAEVSKYQAEIQKVTGLITSQLNKFQQEVQKESQRITSGLSKYQAELEFKSQLAQVDVSIYSAEVGKESARVQSEASKYSSELSKESARIQQESTKFQNELSMRTAQMNQQVQKYSTELSKEQARVQNEASIYQAELSKEAQQSNYELQEWNANLQKKVTLYNTIISKLNTDYQWLQGQYQVVKQELSEFMTPYTQSGKLDSTAEGVRR